MLPITWEPVSASGAMLVGPKGDGGYVVVCKSMACVTLLISMGLNDDWRFEEDFNRRTGASVVCFDGSVDARFWVLHLVKSALRLHVWSMFHYLRYRRFFSRPNIRHERKMVGYDGPKCVSLETILSDVPDRTVFLKMDIEGAEYRVLDDIVRHSHRFTAIVIEFHEVDLHRNRIDRFLGSLTDFAITALHPNNWGGVDRDGDPLVLEMTLTRLEFVTQRAHGENAVALPQTNPKLPDVVARFG